MPSPATSLTKTGTRFPILYTVWFLYIEPLFALIAAYLNYFHPETYLHMTNFPFSSTTAPLPPSTSHLSTHLAGVYLFFGLAQATVLRSTDDKSVWRALCWCMVCSDLVYVHGLWEVGGGEGGEWIRPWVWDGVGWGFYGTTWWALVLRLCYLMGFGLDR